MPLPTPTANENRDDFVSRCMDDEAMVSEHPDQEQRVAVCNSLYGEKENAQDLETKDISEFMELKAIDDEKGAFEGYGSMFGNKDSHGDVVEKGAFAEAVKMHKRGKRKVKLLWQHRKDMPIGVFDELREDDKGLFVKGRLFVDQSVPEADKAYSLLKGGAIDGLSIGYIVTDSDITRSGTRKIKSVNLLEVSMVTMPANEKATVTNIKSELDYTARGVEKTLRDAGYPRIIRPIEEDYIMSDELKSLTEQLGTVHKEFKDTAEQMKQEKAKFGDYRAETEKKFNEQNESITAIQKSIDEVKAAIERDAFVSSDERKEKKKAVEDEILNAFFRTNNPDRVDLSQVATKFMNENEIEAKELSVQIPEDGGYSVLPDFMGLINGRVFETSPMRQEATVQTTSTDRVIIDVDDDEAASGWVGEDASRPETNTPQFNQVEIPIHEIYANPRATQKILDDSQYNLEQWLAGKVADKFRREENNAFVLGNSAVKPKGFTTYAEKTTNPDAYTFNQMGVIETTGNNVINGKDLNDLYGLLKAEYLQNAKWFMSRTTESYIRSIVSLDGTNKADNFIWQPGLQQGAPNTLNGYPVVRFEDMADADGTASTAGNKAIAFGDMRQTYMVVDRIGIRVLRDPYTAKPKVTFYSTKRVGGGAVSFDAMKFLKIKSA